MKKNMSHNANGLWDMFNRFPLGWKLLHYQLLYYFAGLRRRLHYVYPFGPSAGVE